MAATPKNPQHWSSGRAHGALVNVGTDFPDRTVQHSKRPRVFLGAGGKGRAVFILAPLRRVVPGPARATLCSTCHVVQKWTCGTSQESTEERTAHRQPRG